MYYERYNQLIRAFQKADVVQMLYKCFVFAGILSSDNGTAQQTKHICKPTFVQCWTNVEDVGPTLYKCYIIQMYCVCSVHTSIVLLLDICNSVEADIAEEIASLT